MNRALRDFQTAFDCATPEERLRLVETFLAWAKDKVEFSQIQFQSLDLLNIVTNETHLNQVLANIKQVIWLRRVESNQIIYVNPTFEVIWGQSRESLYANPELLVESVHPEDREQVMTVVPIQTKDSYSQVYRIQRPDEEIRWIYANTLIIRNEKGKADFLLTIADDISEQKRLELASRKTLERIREQGDLGRKMSIARKPELVLETLMTAHEFRSARRATLLHFEDPKAGPSRGMEIIASWVSNQGTDPWVSESALYEEPAFWELIRPTKALVINNIQSDPRITPIMRDYLLEEGIQTVTIFPKVAMGEWSGCLIVYFKEEHLLDHKAHRHLKVLVDQAAVTIYNLLLLKTEAVSRLEAERANEIKTKFLAMISHELRTPLTSIIGFTTTLLAKDVTWTPGEMHDFIHMIQQESERLQELIDQLLDLSRLEAGMLPITPKPCGLPVIMEEAFPQILTLTKEHILITHIPENLPKVFADPRRIAQVIVNLMRNASTYSPPGTEISLSAFLRKDFIQIEVSDLGVGIPASEHRKLFKSFHRGTGAENSRAQGAGLGLAICKRLIDAHGGRIWIKKKTTPGTTFSFTLPLANGNDEMDKG